MKVRIHNTRVQSLKTKINDNKIKTITKIRIYNTTNKDNYVRVKMVDLSGELKGSQKTNKEKQHKLKHTKNESNRLTI